MSTYRKSVKSCLQKNDINCKLVVRFYHPPT